MPKNPFTARPVGRLIRASLLVACLGATSLLVSACPGHQLVPADTPGTPGTEDPSEAIKLATPILLTAPTLRTVSAFRIAGYHVLSDPAISFDTPVPGAEVRAIPTTGGLTVIGTTDASGRVVLRLDINKVYTIVASFTDAAGQPRNFRTFAKVTEADRSAPPTQPLDFATSLVAEAIAQGRDQNSLPTLDVTKIQQAVKSTMDLLKAKPELFTAVVMETDTRNPAAVNQALQTLSLAKQLDPVFANFPDPIDALAVAQRSVDPTNSLAQGGTPSAAPPTTPPAPPVVSPVVTKPPASIQRFEMVEGPDTLYLPFGNGATDPAYPQSRLFKARTVLSNGLELPVALWSIVSGDQGGKIAIEGGLVRVLPGASAGTLTIRANSLAGAGFTAERTVSIVATPRRVASAQVNLPAGVPALYVPSDGSSLGDNNLGHPTALQLAWELNWNDRAVSRGPEGADALEWRSLNPDMLAVDALGHVRALPGSREGTASIALSTKTEPSIRTEIMIPVRRAAELVVDIK